MIEVPGYVNEAFKKAFISQAAKMVSFKRAEEGSDGVIYRFEGVKPDQLLKIIFIEKRNLHSAKACIEARLKFLKYLNDHGASVLKLIPSLSGSLYETSTDERGCWLAYSMEKAPGKTMSPKIRDPEVYQNWGQAVGRMHKIAQSYSTWKGCIDPTTGDSTLTWQNEWRSFFDLCQEEDICEQWSLIKDELDCLPVKRDCFGFIHNDPHLWNVQVNGKRVTLLDFDVALHHWFVNDIAIACQHVLFMQSGGLNRRVHHFERLEDFLKLFMAGYARENSLEPIWLSHLDTFIAYRRILLYIVMAGWRQSDPELHDSWYSMIINNPKILSDFSP